MVIQHRLKSQFKINLILSEVIDKVLNERMIILLLVLFNHLFNLSNPNPEVMTISQLLSIYLIMAYKFNKYIFINRSIEYSPLQKCSSLSKYTNQ